MCVQHAGCDKVEQTWHRVGFWRGLWRTESKCPAAPAEGLSSTNSHAEDILVLRTATQGSRYVNQTRKLFRLFVENPVRGRKFCLLTFSVSYVVQ